MFETLAKTLKVKKGKKKEEFQEKWEECKD